MATLTATKKYTSGDQWASLIFTLTYSVNNSDPATSTLTPSSLKITTGQSTAKTNAQKINLDQAKATRSINLNNGVAYKVTYNGVTIANATTHSTGSQSISTTARNVSKTHATQTKTLTLTGAGVTNTASISIPVRTSYKVTYNANGGSGGVTSGTKWHGETLTLPTSNLPTRAGYKFAGWGASADATSAQDTYTGNTAKTFYAVWEAQITGITLAVSTLRVADGTSTTEADEGTWCHGTCDYTVTGAAAGTLTLDVTVDPTGPSIQTSQFTAAKSAGNTLTGSIEFWASGCSVNSSYTFTVNASCTNDSATQDPTTNRLGDVLSSAYYPMDVLGNGYTGQRPGHGIAFGGPCKTEGFHVYMPADVNGVEISNSGWQTLPLASGWSEYSASYTPKYRRVGPFVEIRGAVKPNTATTLNATAQAFANLPIGCRPSSVSASAICQASGVKVWLLTVGSDGYVSASRMRTMNSADYQSASTTEFMFFDVTFLAG